MIRIMATIAWTLTAIFALFLLVCWLHRPLVIDVHARASPGWISLVETYDLPFGGMVCVWSQR